MSLTTETATEAVTVPTECITHVTEQEVIGRVIAETNCRYRRAAKFVALLRRVVANSRGNGGCYYFTDDELQANHDLLDVVMPDDRRIAPAGSAQEGLHYLLLTGTELAIVHTADYTRGVRHCVGMLVTESIDS